MFVVMCWPSQSCRGVSTSLGLGGVPRYLIAGPLRATEAFRRLGAWVVSRATSSLALSLQRRFDVLRPGWYPALPQRRPSQSCRGVSTSLGLGDVQQSLPAGDVVGSLRYRGVLTLPRCFILSCRAPSGVFGPG